MRSQEEGRPDESVIAFENVSVVYRHEQQDVVALEDLGFSVGHEEFLCVLGPSGCGKSTILHLIAGFILPTTGVVRMDGRELRAPGSDRGVVFQSHALFPWKTVEQNIEFGLRMRGIELKERQRVVSQYLDLIGLPEFGRSYPQQLSVGMRQRVALARAYANDPKVLLMDEPFASLDSQTALRMRELLLDLWAKNRKTVVFVTHDVEEAILLGERILVLSDRPGRVREEFLVDLPRPRSRECLVDTRYVELRKKILDSVFVTEPGSSL